MRTFIQIVLFSAAVITTVPAVSQSITGLSQTEDSSHQRTRQLLHRLEHISDADKSGLTKNEKYGLRKELKGIRKELKSLSESVHVSLGIAIIAVFLLSLLLS